MDRPFPLGFPLPTAFYLTLYVATLVIHVVFMNYVLAGSAYLAAFTLLRRRSSASEASDPIAAPLRDWLPFLLSAAITAGIAPLLFVQILYQRQFYSANLLLFHRWMAILPVLIVGFYLLYLLKSRLVSEASIVWRIAVGCGAFLCFAFTAWAWTENHLLSLNEAVWPDQYASGRLFYRTAELFPRLALWFTGAFPTLATLLGWQCWYAARRGNIDSWQANQRCTRLAVRGLTAAAVCGVWYGISLSPEIRAAFSMPIARWPLTVAVAGLAIQFATWFFGRGLAVLTARRLLVVSGGLLMTLTGASVLREVRRLAALEMGRLHELHADARQVGGLTVFLAFAAINFGLIAASIVVVRRGLRRR